MLCQAKAFLPASTNSGGTPRRLLSACRSAARSSSSSQPLVTTLTPCLLVLFAAAGNGGDMWRAAQPVQAPGAHRADAAHAHAQRCADVFVASRRIADQQGQQLAAAARQFGERGPDASVALRRE